MGQIRDTVEQLYATNALLGFAICNEEGSLVHNESFFSDDAVMLVISTLSSCVDQLGVSNREVKRLTLELDDLIVIFTPVTEGSLRGAFFLSRSCDLDTSADLLATLADE